MRNQPRWPTLIVLAGIAACGGEKPATSLATIDTLPGGIVRTISHAPADSGQWQLVLERTLQPDEGTPGELNDFGDLVLADDGTLFVIDEKPIIIKRFDPQGKFVRTYGREGDGPGEFRTGFLALRGDTLAIQDPRASRATMLNITDGSVIATRPTACCYWSPISLDSSGRAVARSIAAPDTLHPAQAFVRFSLDGKSLDTVLVAQRGDKDRSAGSSTIPAPRCRRRCCSRPTTSMPSIPPAASSAAGAPTTCCASRATAATPLRSSGAPAPPSR
jgi:hypothetical protein